ncbi:MAG: hypothetical protein NZ896_03920 [Nitrososphaerales archaeon]|nr:hypothetical protein [Nitrososphaerales archaeon]
MVRRALLLLILALSVVLSSPPFFTQVDARAEGPSITYTRAGYKDFQYTGFNITIPTEDGGRVDIIFAWEMVFKRRDTDSLRVYNTYPTLQMVKFLKDNTLDYSLTYTPLYLVIFEDVNGNGLFDVRTRKGLAREVLDEEVDWRLSRDKPLKMYPLAPMFIHFERREPVNPWSWKVTKPTKAKDALEYSWNASASVRSFGWRFIDERYRFERDHIDVRFYYRLTLKPEGPVVKLGCHIDGIKKAFNEDVKLAVISAVLYHGRDEVIVKGEEKYESFSGAFVRDQRVLLIKKVGESVRSLITHNPDAVIDSIYQTNVVSSALQPVFIMSTPPDLPGGIDMKSLRPYPNDKVDRYYSITFAHQLAFLRLGESISQDPEIIFIAPLLISPPTILLNLQWFIVTALVIFIMYILLKVVSRRLLQEL